MYSLIDDCAKYAIDNLESHVVSHSSVMIKDVFSCLTMDEITKCAFGTDTNAKEDPYNPFVINGLELFNIKVYNVLLIKLCPKFILKLLKFNQLSVKRIMNSF